MLALTYNDHREEYEPTEALTVMDVLSFVSTFKYDIDQLYIDKFWASIDKNDWIAIDYDMLRWMGYNYTRDRKNKEIYLELLANNFVQPKDYDIVSRGEWQHRPVNGAALNTIVIRARSFKKSLMMIRTERAGQVRDYFLALEELVLDYMKYTNLVSQHNRSLETEKLNESIQVYKNKIEQLESTQFEMEALLINDAPIEYKEHVYFLTSKRYYNLNLVKIGKTISLKQRLVGYNTGNALTDDQQFYLCDIKTSDSKSLEKQLHCLLNNFHYHKEWYRISQIDLLSIVKFVANQQDQLKSHIDQIIRSQAAAKAPLSLDEFVKLSKPKVEHEGGFYELDDKFFCSRCNKDYKTLGRIQNHLSEDACRESKTGDYKCPKCSKSFAVKYYFDKHCDEDTCGPRTLFECKECSKTYASQKPYDKHIAEGCHRFVCDKCEKVCGSRQDLNKHMNRQTPCNAVTADPKLRNPERPRMSRSQLFKSIFVNDMERNKYIDILYTQEEINEAANSDEVKLKKESDRLNKIAAILYNALPSKNRQGCFQEIYESVRPQF
jgi:hypothetical protein